MNAGWCVSIITLDKSMTSCFISYAREDKVFVQGLADKIREYHHTIWIDYKDIHAGAEWENEIQKGITNSEVLLVVVTPRSVESLWVRREIELAAEKQKEIIPLLVYSVPIPVGLERLGIAHLHFIDFLQDGFEVAIHKLVQTLYEKSTPRKLKCLVIEDEDAYRQNLDRILSSMNISVTQAKTFRSAYNYIRSEQFDLVTLDMQLRDMDPDGQEGIQLLDQLRFHQRGVPVIIISGLDWRPMDVRSFLKEYDAFDFLQKPLRPNDLRAVVEKAVRRRP
jgi:CheY-like chemotaxis protein